MNRLIAAIGVLLMAGCSSTPPEEDERDLASLVDLIAPDRERPEVDLAKIESHPLGTQQNPVRVNGPAGERSYLSRLRCKGGETPAFKRLGSSELSPFGFIMDIYDVSCPEGPAAEVFMDMYHSKHKEARAIPGFQIEPEGT